MLIFILFSVLFLKIIVKQNFLILALFINLLDMTVLWMTAKYSQIEKK